MPIFSSEYWLRFATNFASNSLFQVPEKFWYCEVTMLLMVSWLTICYREKADRYWEILRRKNNGCRRSSAMLKPVLGNQRSPFWLASPSALSDDDQELRLINRFQKGCDLTGGQKTGLARILLITAKPLLETSSFSILSVYLTSAFLCRP